MIAANLILPDSGYTAPVIPPVWNILADDFEGGTLDLWETSPLSPSVAPGGGLDGSIGLSVPVSADSAYIYQTEVAKAEEGYLSFWFNPNGVSLPEPDPHWWPPGTSLSIAEVVNSDAVQAALEQEPWLLLDRVPPDVVDRLGAALDAQALVVGSLLTYEYRDASGEKIPQVSLSLRLMQCPGGRVLWSAVHSRDGDDSEWLFGFGRVRGLEQLAIETIQEMLADFPAPRRDARGDHSAQRGK